MVTSEDRQLRNRWQNRIADIGGTHDYTLPYDAVGNLTDDGEGYEYVSDAFGRLKEVRKTSNQALVAEYRYNALGFRIGRGGTGSS